MAWAGLHPVTVETRAWAGSCEISRSNPRVFPATRPLDERSIPTLLPRSSDFRRRLRSQPLGTDTLAGVTRLSSLDPHLLQDLQRFELRARAGDGLEVLEVLAAVLRHGRALRLMVEHRSHVLPLTAMPRERELWAPVAAAEWETLDWAALRVLQVEPAPGREFAQTPGATATPLGTVLWALALHGARAELLPEIAGPAAYRIAPSTDLGTLRLSGALANTVARLQRQAASLEEIARWPGMSRERASRLLNGLYLQAGLIVSRAHPSAG